MTSNQPKKAAKGREPNKYRWLKNGEKKLRGDTFKDFDGKWKPIVFANEAYSEIWDEPVRREVKPKRRAAK